MAEADHSQNASVRFVFNCVNDLAATRRFYVELLGMAEAGHMDTPEFGYLAVQCDGFQMMWFRADAEVPVPTEFTCQPGWAGGTLEVTSWAVRIPEDRFADVYGKLVAAEVPMFAPEPEWRQDSYWGISALDPTGVTVEVYTAPKERPAKTEWPAEGEH